MTYTIDDLRGPVLTVKAMVEQLRPIVGEREFCFDALDIEPLDSVTVLADGTIEIDLALHGDELEGAEIIQDGWSWTSVEVEGITCISRVV